MPKKLGQKVRTNCKIPPWSKKTKDAAPNNSFSKSAQKYNLTPDEVSVYLTLFYMGFWKYVILGKKACFGKNWLMLPIIYAFGVELLSF